MVVVQQSCNSHSRGPLVERRFLLGSRILCSGTRIANSRTMNMRFHRFIPLFSAALLLVESTSARADEANNLNRWHDRPLSFELHLAPFGSPLGHGGIAFDYALVPAISAFAGVGLGRASPQVVGGLRGRAPLSDRTAFGFSPSVSIGSAEAFCTDIAQGCEDVVKIDYGVWINGELSWEHRSSGGRLFRVYGGASFLTKPGRISRETSSGEKPDFEDTKHTTLDWMPFVGVALGHAF